MKKKSAPKVAIKTSEISPLHNKHSEAVVAEQRKFASQLFNSMCHKAESQNGRFCTLIIGIHCFLTLISKFSKWIGFYSPFTPAWNGYEPVHRIGGREGGIILQKWNLKFSFGVFYWWVRKRAHTHVHLTLSNTVHEADAARGNDHFARYPSEVRGGHPCHWTPAGSKTIPWRNINSYWIGAMRAKLTYLPEIKHSRCQCSDYWAVSTRQLAALVIVRMYIKTEDCKEGE